VAAARLRRVSALGHYKLAGFSVECPMNLLMTVDHDVEIVIRRKPRSRKATRTDGTAVIMTRSFETWFALAANSR
jgi:hypothetical protein